MIDVKKELKDEIAIADFRFEDAKEGFHLFIQRELGCASLFQLGGIMLFVVAGLWGLSTFTLAIFRSTAGGGNATSHGPPVCCFPFILGFFALWLSVPLRGLWGWWQGRRGAERWKFGPESIVPGGNPLARRTALPLVGVVRAGLSEMGGIWAVGISAAGIDLTIGPFKKEEMARRFENELRRRKSEWFVDAAGSEIPFGLAEQKTTESPEPIEAYEWSPAPDGFDLLLRRKPSSQRYRGAGFLVLWLCGWAAGEIITARFLVKSYLTPSVQAQTPAQTQPATHRSKTNEPPRLFLTIWLTFWTFGGGLAMLNLGLHFKIRERWQFREGQVIAGRNWQLTSKRTLRDEGNVHGRMVRTIAGAEIELISIGLSLRLGPLTDEAARELVEELKLRRPAWVWR